MIARLPVPPRYNAGMSNFIPPDIPGTWHRNGGRFTTSAPLAYVTRDGYVIVVPAGYRTDFASVPRLAQVAFPPTGRYQFAAVIHDWLCDTHHAKRHTMSRAWVDGVFYEAMAATGVGWRTRWSLYLAVRAGSWMYWSAHKDVSWLPAGDPFVTSGA